MEKINRFLDRLSEYFAHRKGLLSFLGILLVCLNFILQLIPGIGWLASSNLFLHVGVIIAILGTMLAWIL